MQILIKTQLGSLMVALISDRVDFRTKVITEVKKNLSYYERMN